MTDDIVTRLREHANGDFEKTSEFMLGLAADEIERLRGALAKIEKAIVDEGPSPSYHRAVMKKHRTEWPTLHRAIDGALETLRGARRIRQHQNRLTK